MNTMNAEASGQFKIGGDLLVHRLGYGAMRITGEGIWGLSHGSLSLQAVWRNQARSSKRLVRSTIQHLAVSPSPGFSNVARSSCRFPAPAR